MPNVADPVVGLPTAMDPGRELVRVFDETEYPTIPSPEPDEPDVIVIQPFAVVAVHAQPVGAFTENVPVEAPEEICAPPEGTTLMEQVEEAVEKKASAYQFDWLPRESVDRTLKVYGVFAMSPVMTTE